MLRKANVCSEKAITCSEKGIACSEKEAVDVVLFDSSKNKTKIVHGLIIYISSKFKKLSDATIKNEFCPLV